MRDLPKSTTHVVKKASDIFVSGERGSAAHHHHLFAGSGSGKLQSPSKVVSSGGSSSRLNRFSEGIKASPTRQSLVVAAESNSFHLTSSDSEDAEAQALNVDEGSDEVSSSGSCTSEVEIDGAGGCGDDDDDDDEDGDGDDDDDDDDFCSVERAVSADDGIGSSLVAKINGGMAHNLASEDSRIPRLKKLRDGKQKDESTCRDDDFTWVNSRNEAPKASIDSDRRSTSHTTVGGRSVRSRTGGGQDPNTTANVAPLTPESPLGPGCGKPPRPMTSSLDRRRHNLGASRYERDTKSRSTHSLKDKSSSSELHKPDSQSSSLSLNSKGKAERKRVGPGKGAIDDKFWIFEEHQHDSGNYNNYNSSGSSHHHHHGNSSRQSPGIWEPPPPPPTSHWDPHYYWNWNHQSREELRLIDYHRRQQEMYRYGSNGALSSTQESPCSSGCCNRGYYQPPPPPCCSCEHSRMIWGKDCQRQDTDERLRRLQTDKEALALQVKVLTEQVQTQSTKITELERTVHEKNKLISNADDLLQREMLSRSSLETQKLELMSAMSELKLQQAALERENLELRSSLVNGSGTLSNGTLLSSSTLNNNNITASIIRRATPMLGIGRMVTSTPGNSINSSPLHHGSHGSLPQQVVTNLPSPSTPKTPPASYRQRVDIHYNSLPRQAFATTLSTVSGSSGSSGASATTNGSSSVDANANLRRNVAFAIAPAVDVERGASSKPAFSMSSSMNALSLTSALGSNLKGLKPTSVSVQNIHCSEPVGTSREQLIDLDQDHQERATTEPPSGSATVVEVPKSPQDARMAAKSTPAIMAESSTQRQPFFPAIATTGSIVEQTIEKTRGFSVPNLADSGTASSDRTDGSASQRNYTPNPTPSPSMSHKNLKGLRNIFGKIKRSNSGTLEDVPLDNGEFRRGGIRATAGARLGWSVEFRKPDKPFREWSLDTLCLWFEQMGLNMYEEELRRWLKVGGAAELAQASPVDIEKELNLKNPLHRKKIVLAVADMAESDESDTLFKNSGKLDTPWVIRWLDDIGLPQHKDSFTAARMDGRMLHKLTMDDLVNLHVSSCLHVASLRRGIQLMREQQWNPDCLIRRSITDDSCGIKDEVQLWSSHRVMEWLRLVDLSEYAPNLRGAGVHGALMMYEVKFTAELLAELLSMPPSKTLLRRHLATHFKELLGRDIIQVKRDAENTLGFQPLTLAAKIKTPKKSQFSLKRKKSSKGQNGDEWSDYVCPMGDSGQEHLPPQRQHPSPSPSASAASSVNSAVVVTTTTSATSANRHQHQHQSHNSHASSASPYSANINHVTSNSMAATTKIPYTTYPDSTLSSSTTSSTTTSGAGSEVASHQQLLTNVNSTAGSDSPTSTRSSTTSTS
ncbi:liprin-beta-1 isoform X2 [Topomyia yanbarensis]|uniref:liprin-beta-1 isoform X2 n=1 Tax=Topomyia yanbarensis TaxID=2498891 RepID=UPI00273A8EB8|nr:liprin-beta-1 isoform X2 [Topomyia yanbarensis]